MSGSPNPGARRGFRHPAQVIAAFFATGVAAGTGLLALPVARAGDGGAGFLEALFTATSALCVTGLSTVDVPSYWSGFGQGVILVLMQVGGLGIMTLASLLALLISNRLGLRSRLNAAGENNVVRLGDIRELVLGILRVSLVIEVAVAGVIAARLSTAYDESFGRSIYLGVFHAVSAFNGAGFSLYSDSLMSFVSDFWVCSAINVAVILGGIGFPVLLELRKRVSPRMFSLHTKITIAGTAVLLTVGFVGFLVLEWTNPATLGGLDNGSRLLAAFTGSAQPRSGGFNSLDYSQMREPTLFLTSTLMFIGGGSASTAGGIKVTTFFLLLFIIVAEVRGTRDVEVADRRIEPRAQRQALAVGLVATGLVVGSTMLLMMLEPLDLNRALFEVTSAFGTVGLSAGVTGTLGAPAQVLVVVLMFVGRIGPVTMVSALALRERQHFYQLPEGRPLIG